MGSRPLEDARDQVDDFICSLNLPVGEALIKSPPSLRVSRAQDTHFIPRRSSRLADKPRAGWPEVQAKNMLLKRWGFETTTAPSQAGTAARFSETFRAPLSSSKREAMRELFADCARRGGRTFVSETSPRP